GGSVLSMMILVTRACAAGAHARTATTTSMNHVARCLMRVSPRAAALVVVSLVVPVVPVVFVLVAAERHRGHGGRRARRRGHALGQAQRDQSRVLAGSVLAQHQAILDHLPDRVGRPVLVLLERRIALLDRLARIAGSQAVGFGLRERDELARALAAIVGLGAGPQRPASICGVWPGYTGQ